jgi:hypothetical protein
MTGRRHVPMVAALFIIVSAALTLSGCASSGKDFVRPDQRSLALGKTTVAEVVAMQGAPTSRSTRHSLNQSENQLQPRVDQPAGFKPAAVAGTLDSLSYRYSRATAPGLLLGPVNMSSKNMMFAFWNDRLVYYDFESAFSGELTDFDENKVEALVIGKSTRTEVIRALGRPNGEGIYPYVAREGTQMLVYEYLNTDSKGYRPVSTEFVTTRKVARLLFDSSGTLLEKYKYTSFTGM